MRRDVQEIFRSTPHSKQVMMFSATLSKDIRPVCKKFMQDVKTNLSLITTNLFYVQPTLVLLSRYLLLSFPKFFLVLFDSMSSTWSIWCYSVVLRLEGAMVYNCSVLFLISAISLVYPAIQNKWS